MDAAQAFANAAVAALQDGGKTHAGAVATALLIRHCAQTLDPNTAFGIAASGFVEGTKTAPEPVHLVSSGR